jgi:thiosulfate dehydrogenase (quinone) large subunit
MDQHSRAVSVTMNQPAKWLALLRIVVGLYFVKSLVTKMSIVSLGGVVPFPMVSDGGSTSCRRS